MLPRGPENQVAIRLIVEHAQDVLDGKTPGFKVPDYHAIQSDILLGESSASASASSAVSAGVVVADGADQNDVGGEDEAPPTAGRARWTC